VIGLRLVEGQNIRQTIVQLYNRATERIERCPGLKNGQNLWSSEQQN
jgi:hypothetical protein